MNSTNEERCKQLQLDEKVSGVVVLYNPEADVQLNILSYLPYLDTLYIVDNSDIKDVSLVANLKSVSKVKYIDNHGNLGIAKALNIAAGLAIKSQMKWLLTMDQDSRFEKEAVAIMLDYLKLVETSTIGIISPLHIIPGQGRSDTKDHSPRRLVSIATSGNLLNLEAYQDCGPFLNELFIDTVDHEYCLRLNSNGYKIIQLPKARLLHHLGDLKRERVCGIGTTVTHHNYLRRYYITRNRLYVSHLYRHQYPKWRRKQIMTIWRDLFKIVFAEQDKLRKLRSVFRGVIDYYKGSLGKYVE